MRFGLLAWQLVLLMGLTQALPVAKGELERVLNGGVEFAHLG